MELNREQAIDILERFDFFQGQRAGRELWNDKPFDVQEQDIANFSRDVTFLKDYIKELTKENERLRAEVSVKKKLLDKSVDLEDKVKADTVRKMQERLGEHFVEHNEVKYGGGLVHKVLDKIAKEMTTDET